MTFFVTEINWFWVICDFYCRDNEHESNIQNDSQHFCAHFVCFSNPNKTILLIDVMCRSGTVRRSHYLCFLCLILQHPGHCNWTLTCGVGSCLLCKIDERPSGSSMWDRPGQRKQCSKREKEHRALRKCVILSLGDVCQLTIFLNLQLCRFFVTLNQVRFRFPSLRCLLFKTTSQENAKQILSKVFYLM